MKKIIILFNVAFLLFGNVVFSNLHFLHNHNNEGCNYSHNHNEKTFKYEECLDCITFENNNDFNFTNNELSTLNELINTLILDPVTFTEYNFNQNYLSRAPPIS
tara:strand:- start:505 stop:816 length:312 start_codon:yes stop_codon:yes gene_type:complete